jgi:hypothetical protein
MIEINFKGNTISIHDDIKEMSIDRFSSFNKNAILDSDIGGDIHSIDKRFAKAHEFLAEGLALEAQKELMNLRKTFFFTINEINPEHFSFACLVAKINGNEYSDYSDGALTQIIAELKKINITKELIDKHLAEVKKN